MQILTFLNVQGEKLKPSPTELSMEEALQFFSLFGRLRMGLRLLLDDLSNIEAFQFREDSSDGKER
ncbi:MAG TPA: hypothetical protein PLH76_06240 [Rectinema sp.]|jgi:hypothetical protein|nr:hypothetical protein [Spirochaetota bacterium]OQC74470.1 MAG: hypothetical protein BWX44_00900 [Spirochaetes bacterium ADurb.Bin001]HNT59917.1 hypothetical protein [Rectinema sp.]HPG95735.1 hypothetical protein [Rectinema sp.]HPN03601.1 hypothetical protein [Rectinema sp.]